MTIMWEYYMPKRILIVDDEPLMLKGLKYSLEQDLKVKSHGPVLNIEKIVFDPLFY